MEWVPMPICPSRPLTMPDLYLLSRRRHHIKHTIRLKVWQWKEDQNYSREIENDKCQPSAEIGKQRRARFDGKTKI